MKWVEIQGLPVSFLQPEGEDFHKITEYKDRCHLLHGQRRETSVCAALGEAKEKSSYTVTHAWEQRIYKCFSEKSDVCYGWGKAGTTGWSHLIPAQENWKVNGTWRESLSREAVGSWSNTGLCLWNQDLNSVKTLFTSKSTSEQGASVAAGARLLHTFTRTQKTQSYITSYTSKKLSISSLLFFCAHAPFPRN